jgi:hypothetical protein
VPAIIFNKYSFLIRPPRVGDLELLIEKFSVVGADGLEALFLHAEPGSRSAEALATLASLVTADQRPAPHSASSFDDGF